MTNPPIEAVNLACNYVLLAVVSGQQPAYLASEAQMHLTQLCHSAMQNEWATNQLFGLARQCGMPDIAIPGEGQ